MAVAREGKTKPTSPYQAPGPVSAVVPLAEAHGGAHGVKIKTEFQDSSQFVEIQDCELGSWSIFFSFLPSGSQI